MPTWDLGLGDMSLIWDFFVAGAKLVLKNPEVLEDWPKSRDNVYVKNKEVRHIDNTAH